MRIRPPVMGRPHWARANERPPMRLDDLSDRLGPSADAIRDALGGETDIAVALAHDLDGDDYVLVATRAGVHVRYLSPVAQDQQPGVVRWASVRVSPLNSDGRHVEGQERPAPGTHACEVRIDGVAFLVSGDTTAGRQGAVGFHDEVVRRGTPWHHPS